MRLFTLAQTNSVMQTEFFSVEQGLASREVFCGTQDKDGFLWFGTRNGLNRFDGKQFKLYTRQQNGLAHNRIFQLVCDQDNHLFMLYGNSGLANGVVGAEVMDPRTGKVQSIKSVFPNLPFDERKIYWIANAGEDLAFLTSAPFALWIYKKGKFIKRFEFTYWENALEDKTKPFSSQGAYYTTTGRHCIFAQDCYAMFITSEYPFYFLTPHGDTALRAPDQYGFIKIVDNQEVILRNKTSISTFQFEKKPAEEFQLISSGLSKEKAANIFIRKNGEDELLAYSEKLGMQFYRKGKWYPFEPPPGVSTSTSESVYSFFGDNQNNYWICSSKGLLKIHFSDPGFTHYFTKEQLPLSDDNQVRGIYRDASGTVYASVWRKLMVQQYNQPHIFQHSNEEILYALHEQNNSLFVGHSNLSVFDMQRKVLHEGKAQNLFGEIWDIDSLNAETLLLAVRRSILTYSITQEKYNELHFASRIPKPDFAYRILPPLFDTQFVVAQNGIFGLNKTRDRVVSFYGNEAMISNNTPTSQPVFPFNNIFDAYQTKEGNFWICTGGEGLWFWNRKQQHYQQYSFQDGLPSDILYRMEADAKGHLWISSDNGLICFHPETRTSLTFNTSNGLSHNEFNRTSSYTDKTGRMYFGGVNGMNAFHPDSVLRAQQLLDIPLKIISFTKFSAKENKWIDRFQELLANATIQLDPGDRLINLEFQLLDFNNKRPVYAYRIEHIDKDWVYTKENHMSLSGLPYGTHELTIKGQMSNGLWSKNVLHLHIVVNKPFYLKWWFLFAALGVLAIAFYFVVKWRTKNLQQSKQKLEYEVNNRTHALQLALEQEQTLLKDKEVLLKEIHHRVKNNLQVISGLLELQEKNLSDETARLALAEGRNRVRSVALIHQNLYQFENLSGIELHTFMQELFKQIWMVYEQQAKPFTLQNEVPFTEIDIDTAVPLGLILNELLTNSFKYAGTQSQNWIRITLQEELMHGNQGKSYVLRYADSGSGISDDIPLKERKSLGLRLISDLSKQIGGRMTYMKEEMSTFTITFLDKEARKHRE